MQKKKISLFDQNVQKLHMNTVNYVVVLGIIYTCTVLRYKRVFIAMR